MSFSDRRLDRRPQWDDRNIQYPIRTILRAEDLTLPRSYTWPLDVVLDQGQEGACVGFSISHELRAKPKVVEGVSNATAFALYALAKTLDPWPGEDYEGTSVLAGVKAAKQAGYYSEYRWATNVDDLAAAVSRKGPAVLGIDWYDGMYDPTWRSGDLGGWWIKREGEVVGGHAILARGYSVTRQAFRLHNSWGPGWGYNGMAWISRDDVKYLLADGGEAVIPVVR
jgi:hypothetical protein